MTTPALLPRSEPKRVKDKQAQWDQLLERLTKAGPLPEVAEILESSAHSEEEVDSLMRRFEAGEFRNQE
jgi:hypothetical protein